MGQGGQSWDYGQLNTIRKASSLLIVQTIGKNIGKDIGTECGLGPKVSLRGTHKKKDINSYVSHYSSIL
jgi:hypothetical protein